MSRKLNYIPHIESYDQIRAEMRRDLDYRLETRKARTSLGRPLYYRPNVQVIMTHECPYHCPFCLERKNPMKGEQDFAAQNISLIKVLNEHPQARVTITGGEPSLYPGHVGTLAYLYSKKSDGVFLAINSAGYSDSIVGIGHINLSVNDCVKPNVKNFPGCTYQTVLSDEKMNIDTIKRIMKENPDAGSFSFRFMSDVTKKDYDVSIWNALQSDDEIKVSTFRIGDFFVYCTFDYGGKHARVTLGDMWQQQHNDYQDGYSNIIIHPDGKIGINWK